MRDRPVVVIGAGFAGAATAFYLTQAGFQNVTVIERETLPGTHASGRNAAMIRQIVPEPAIAALAREGCRFIHDWARSRGPQAFLVNGSILLASGDTVHSLREQVDHAQRGGTEAHLLTHAQATRRAPILESASFDLAAWCPSDGVVDIAALLQFFLSEATRRGARVMTGVGVDSIETKNGRVAAVQAGGAVLPCEIVVNAAGAWVNEMARLAGVPALPMTPYRRHIMVTTAFPSDRHWPFVWNVSEQIYFRPEPPGLLLSPCDQTEHAPAMPCTDESAFDLLHTKLQKCFPALLSISVGRSWAGLRTISRDGNFVIGFDPRVSGFFWLAGMGGHGVTCSAGIGRMAADLICGDSRSDAQPFRPERLI